MWTSSLMQGNDRFVFVHRSDVLNGLWSCCAVFRTVPVKQGAMQTALSRLCNRGGFDIPWPAVDLDMGVPSQSQICGGVRDGVQGASGQHPCGHSWWSSGHTYSFRIRFRPLSLGVDAPKWSFKLARDFITTDFGLPKMLHWGSGKFVYFREI